ncbi:MAG: hypothetical protein H7Z73_12360 [Candidatus Saccharibacteria bacterium]|nr:hypothetical protein [Moraxellaceae bacterium]
MRYFIICYIFLNKHGEQGRGFKQFQQDSYPSFKHIAQAVGLGLITISNIIELNECDYKSFNSLDNEDTKSEQ